VDMLRRIRTPGKTTARPPPIRLSNALQILETNTATGTRRRCW
jgi:hypothetical protein